jgi:hypothetical protein
MKVVVVVVVAPAHVVLKKSSSIFYHKVIVSIQSLIMVPDPYFNEPGYERDMGTQRGNAATFAYNSERRVATVRWAMVEQLRSPPPGFEAVVQRHFRFRRSFLRKQCTTWIREAEEYAAKPPAAAAAGASGGGGGYGGYSTYSSSAIASHATQLKKLSADLEKLLVALGD